MCSTAKKAFRRWEFWVSIVALAIAVGLWTFSIVYSARINRKLSEYTHIQATVTDNELIEDSNPLHRHGSTFAPVVEYTVNGITYTAQDKMSTSLGKRKGSQIEIAFNPENPSECLFVVSEKSLFAFLYVFSAGFSAAGIATATYLAKDLKREKLMNTYPNAKFITSAASNAQFITADKPIIAVCGKSNVGKSSFINMLANQKKLAKTSQSPGRTRLINYFDFGAFILADLPGYGYARVSKSEKAKWAKLLDDFFADKEKIAHVFSLCDIRHDPTENDITMVNYLYQRVIPFTVIATKADKLSRSQIDKALTNIAAIYKCGKGDIIATSAQTKQGLQAVIEEIEKVIDR